MTDRVAIARHERFAMEQLVLNARAMAGLIDATEHGTRLLVWAQAVEDVLGRLDGETKESETAPGDPAAGEVRRRSPGVEG
jgi:hypothetical protein